jgi:hypothetical protein
MVRKTFKNSKRIETKTAKKDIRIHPISTKQNKGLIHLPSPTQKPKTKVLCG